MNRTQPIVIGVFAGYGALGRAALDRLLEDGYAVDFVLTHRDDGPESVATLCTTHHIKFSFLDIRRSAISELNAMQNLGHKLLLSVNYRYILPEGFIRSFKYALNLHGSLLPQYRGRTPHVWAIINGETKTGITCHVMEPSVDTGAIVHQIEIPIESSDSGSSLLKKFESLYPEILALSLKRISDGFAPTAQDESCATYFGKRTPDMGYLDFNKDCQSTLNFIRAQARPYPGAYCFLPDTKKVIVHAARSFQGEMPEKHLPSGAMIVGENGLIARFSDGYLIFTDYEIV